VAGRATARRRDHAGGDLSHESPPRDPSDGATGFAAELGSGWPPLSGPVAFGAVVFVLWVLLRATTGDHWVPILDHANLVFHEAGHVIVGLLSDRLAVYGGTLGQLFFPVAAAWQFLRRRHTVGFALAAGWACESLLNVATYMADARAMQLPLIGGLDPAAHHDWREIFARWDMLHLDTAWAGLNRVIAWLGGVALCFWLMRRWLAGRAG
jgi:hypothetical protein